MPARLVEWFDFSISCGTETDIEKTLAEIPARRGLLLFADAHDQPIQMLMCADLRRSARTRLLRQSETPTRRADISAVCTAIYYSPIDTEFACQIAFNQRCRALFPDTCGSLIRLPKPCFVHLEKRLQPAYFAVSEKYSAEGLYWGPFIRRKNAVHFAEILNTAFELCRNPSCLSSGRFASCPYYQMRTCRGPCLDAAQSDDYLQRLNHAVAAASGQLPQAVEQKQLCMRQAAERLDFETAQQIRNQIELLAALGKKEFQFIRPLSRFCFLHLDPLKSGRKKPRWAAFILTAFAYTRIAFELETIDTVIQAVSSAAGLPPASETDYLATVCLFLYRSRRAGLWLDCSITTPTRPFLLEQMQTGLSAMHDKPSDSF